MNPSGKTFNCISSHPLINWILGVIFASLISAIIAIIVEVYFINNHISEWKSIEVKHRLAHLQSPNSYYSRKRKDIATTMDENFIIDIDKIESFYDRRFVPLLWTMGMLVSLTGVLLPIIFAIIQQQSAKTEKIKIDNSFKEIEKLSNVLKEEAKQNDEKFKSLHREFYLQNAKNYHGFAESWFRQYQESGGVAIVGAAIVYCGIAMSNNQMAFNGKGLRSNILMLKRIDDCLSDSNHSMDKGIVVSHLKSFRWPVASSEIRVCMERDINLAEKYIDLSVETYEKITDTYGIPNIRDDE